MRKQPGGQNSGNHPIRTVKVKRIKENEDSLRDIWDNIKYTNIYIIEVWNGEERKGQKIYLKK